MWQILIIIGITGMGMWGGQQNKWVRRYLLPLIASVYVAAKKDKKKWKATFFLPLIGILSMGYGENSKLRQLLGGSDKLTRIAYGLLMSLPFLLFGKWWACLALPLAWSVRAGGIQLPNGKDFLWEDLWRYCTIGVLIIL